MPTRRKRSTHFLVKRAGVGSQTRTVASGIGNRYLAAIGLPPTDSLSLHQVVKEGVPFRALKQFQSAFDLKRAEVMRLVQIPESTFARRREKGRLDPTESDRLLRMTRIFDLAQTAFEGDLTEARGWLSRPQRVLGNAVPLDLATTEVGAQEVERALLRLEYGVYA